MSTRINTKGLFGLLWHKLSPPDNPFWQRLVRKPRYFSDLLAIISAVLALGIAHRPALIIGQWISLLFLAILQFEMAGRYVHGELRKHETDSTLLPGMPWPVIAVLIRYFAITAVMITALFLLGVAAFVFAGTPMVTHARDLVSLLLTVLLILSFQWMYFWSRLASWKMTSLGLVATWGTWHLLVGGSLYFPQSEIDPWIVAGTSSIVMLLIGSVSLILFIRRSETLA